MICAHRRREERRKEVGCQWEGPEKHRKEVGCQSDVAERRDAGVQVDLLTQLSWRHSGVPWQCATVRAGEPQGGALLQPCGAHTSCSGQHVSHLLQHGTNSPALYLLCPTLLPTVFSEHTETSLHPQASPSPSVPLLMPAGGSAAPPGLIAPLSPRLAEEEDEDNEEHFCSNQAALKEEKMDKEDEKRGRPDGSKREESSPADKLTNHITGKVEPSKRRKQKMKEDEEFQVSKQREKQQLPAAQIQEEQQRQRMPTEQKDEEETGGQVDLMKDELLMKEGGGIKSMTMKNEVVEPQRPRRRMVGPTIRYLLEFEQQSHGPTAANQCRARGDDVKRKVGRPRKEQKEVEEVMEEQTNNSRVESSADTGAEGWWQLCQVCGLNITSQASLDLRMSVHGPKQRFVCHPCNRKFSHTSKLCLHHHHHLHGSGDGVGPISTQTDVDKQEEQDNDAQGEEDEDKEDPGCLVEYCTLKRRKEGAQEKNGARGAKSCREEVKQVCVEEEEEPPQRPRRTMVGPPIRYLLESEETSHSPGTVSHTSQDLAKTPKPRGRPKMVASLSEAGGGTSEKTDRPEEEERGHMVAMGGIEDEEPQRQRKTVGPPIRYLLESEETSRVSETANQGTENKPTERRGRSTKVFDLSEAGGGASELIDRPQAEAKEISHMVQNARREDEKEEESQRPRITVGPPIRYLLDSDETSHGLQTANHNAENKPTQRTGSPQKVSIHRPKRMFGCHLCNRKFSRATRLLHHHRCHHHSNRDGLHNNGDEADPSSARAGDDKQEEQDTDAQGDEEEKEQPQRLKRTTVGTQGDEAPCEPVLTGPTEAPNCLREIKRVSKNPRWLLDYWTLKVRRKGAQEKGGGRGTKRCREEDEEDEEERREVKQVCVEKEQEPQRLRRTMVGPPIRYLLESEELSHSKQVANKQAERRQTLEQFDNLSEAEGGASKADHKETGHIVAIGRRETEEEEELPQRPKRMVGLPIRYLLEAEETSHDPRTVKQTNQETANKPTARRGRPKTAVSFSEAGGGASETIDRPEAEAKEMGHMVQKATRENEQEEEHQRPRRTVGPPIRYLLGSEEISHGALTANRDAENKHTQRTGIPQQVSVHRPKRMFGCHLCNRKFSRATKLLLHHRRHHHSNRDGLHDNGDEAGPGSTRACDDKQEEQDTGAQGDEEEEVQPQRPRRRTVGPPIRYLLESEEMSGTANQIIAKLIQRRGRPKKVVGGSDAGGGASGMIDRPIAVVSTERQTGLHTETYLVYRDLQDNQVTIIAPCCVRMQRLL